MLRMRDGEHDRAEELREGFYVLVNMITCVNGLQFHGKN